MGALGQGAISVGGGDEEVGAGGFGQGQGEAAVCAGAGGERSATDGAEGDVVTVAVDGIAGEVEAIGPGAAGIVARQEWPIGASVQGGVGEGGGAEGRAAAEAGCGDLQVGVGV